MSVGTRIVTSRPKPATTHRRPRAITAAARKIELATREGRQGVRKPETWQDEAWAFLDALPEIKFAAGFMGNSLSRLRLFPAVIVDPDEPPVPLADADGIPADMAEAADEELDRIGSGGDGWPGLLRTFGVCLTIAGEAYLIGRAADDNPFTDEVWGVYSSNAVSRKGDTTILHEAPGDKGIELPEDSLIYRVWRRHPRYPALADSNMRAVLDAAEELVLWGRRLRSIAKSGTNAGAYWLPDELDFAPVQPGDNEPGSDHTPLEEELINTLVTPVEDDGSAAAVAPFIGRGKGDWISKIRYDTFGRNLDDKTVERIEHLVRRMAHGLDLPVEILTGMAASNHWTAWLVDDMSYRAHVEPTAGIPAAGIASAFLRPALLERQFPAEVVRRVVLGIDPSALVVRPNRGADARDAYQAGEISGDAFRRYLGMTDADAPSDDERIRRYVFERGPGGQDLTAVLMNRTVTEDNPIPLPSEISAEHNPPPGSDGPPGGGPGVAPEDGGDPLPPTLPAAMAPPAALPAAVTAAADDPGNEDPWEALALLLAGIDAALMQRLQVAASDDVNEALRVAGNRLRAAAQGDPDARERLRGVAPQDAARALGPTLAAQLAGEDRLLDGALESLRDRWGAWVAAAQDRVAALLERAAPSAPDPVAARDAIAAYRAHAEERRDAGWAVLAVLLLGVVQDRLWSDAAEIVRGEHDPTVAVPAGVIRDALTTAGGGDPGVPPTGPAGHAGPGGLAVGPDALGLVARAGGVVTGWRWETGMPAHPFEPHQRLDGVEFAAWDDPRLASTTPWPAVSHYRPGDHRGCQCWAAPILAAAYRGG